MNRHLILHPGARTRALYAWEADELMLGSFNPRFTQADCQKFAKDFWLWSGRKRSGCPEVQLIDNSELSYAQGRTFIALHIADSGPVILTHELVHCLGFGQGRLVHPVSFVRAYIDALVRHVRMNRTMLIESAMIRGLL